MELRVTSDVWQRFPGIRIVVAVVSGLDNTVPRPAVQAALEAAWAEAGAERDRYPNAQSHPNVAAWREAFKANGLPAKEFPSSIEALLRRAMKGGSVVSINPLIDLIHATSLHRLVPVGGFDLDALQGDMWLRLTRDGDVFTSLDAEGQVTLPAGEVAYADEREVLTRHFVWRQARTGLVDENTRRAVLVAEVLGGLPKGLAAQVAADFETGVQEHFGLAARAQLLDQESAVARLDEPSAVTG